MEIFSFPIVNNMSHECMTWKVQLPPYLYFSFLMREFNKNLELLTLLWFLKKGAQPLTFLYTFGDVDTCFSDFNEGCVHKP
jgi:hypothetical protein